jgi:hypothetical protein
VIYRIQTDLDLTSRHDGRHDRGQTTFRSRLIGAGSVLGGTMWERRLPAPDFDNPRARFYFTEKGWRRVGRYVAAAGRQSGHVVQVIRRKNPRRSEIVFQDDLQVALLPRRRPY